MATEHNPEEKTPCSPSMVLPSAPYDKKELFILTPTDILAISLFVPLFSVLRDRGHTRLLSSISKARRPGPDGALSRGSSDWELKMASAEGYSPPPAPQPPRPHCFPNIP